MTAATTLAAFAGQRAGNYCTLPTIDVPILPDVRLCNACDREVVHRPHPKGPGWGLGRWVHPSVSAWLRGLRFATVSKIGQKWVHVTLDNVQPWKARPQLLRPIDTPASCTCGDGWSWTCRLHGMND